MLTAAFAMGMTLLILNWIAAPQKPTWIKAAPYESGIPNVTPVQARYTARFYIVAMLFVIFDIEAIFLFPWAVLFTQDRKSTRLNSSHANISYAVFCLKKKIIHFCLALALLTA